MAAAPVGGGSSPEVAGFLASLRVEKAASVQTLRCYQLDLDQFVSWLAHTAPSGGDLASASHLTVREFLAHLQRQQYARRTMARKLSCLKSFFHYLCQTGQVAENPVHSISAPKPEVRPPEILPEEAIARLLALPDPTTPLGLRDKALLELLYATGMRVSELVGLSCSQVDLREGWVTILPVGHQERHVPVGGAARAALAAYQIQGRPQLAARVPEQRSEPPEHQPLFLNRWGTRLTERSVRRVLDRYVEQVSTLGRASPQSIRQSCAAHLLGRGADLAAVQEMLGHSSLSATQRYAPGTGGGLRQEYLQAHPRERSARANVRPTAR